MDPKKIALLIGAAVVALGSGFMAMSMFRGHTAPKAVAAVIPVADTGPQILVATKPLQVGTIIDPTAFRFQPWPKDLVDKAYYIKGQVNEGTLAGTVVRSTISVGQPLTNGALVSPGDRGFLAAALAPGMRAVTFPVGAGASGVSGFVYPGDRVDMILTQSVAGGPGQSLKTTETIVRNLRVLAVDARSSQAPADPATGMHAAAPFSLVTVEATPRIAEKITVAQTLGALSLSLRSIADNQADLERAIASGQISLPKNDPAGERKIINEFAARPVDNQVSFVTGGDVSHFQRKSVPEEGHPPRPMHTGGNSPVTASGIEPRPALAPPPPPTVTIGRGAATEVVQVGGGPKSAAATLGDALSNILNRAATSASPGSQNSGKN
jgi:pilus assembly protein CpaB